MNTKISQNRGFMQIVFLAVVIIAGLAYFKIDLRTLFETQIVQSIWHILVTAWDTYIKPLFVFLYTNIYALFNK